MTTLATRVHEFATILSLLYSNGPTEGVNTKIKLLKRQTYGKPASACYAKESFSPTDRAATTDAILDHATMD